MIKNDDNVTDAYKPSEVIGIFNASLSKQNEFAKLVYLRGIYQKRQNNPNWSYCYNGLRDENTQCELTLRIAKEMQNSLNDGNLVRVGGLLERKIDLHGSIQITFNVTRIDKLQEQVVSETDQKKAELRRCKAQTGFCNVDGVLEQLLLADRKPKVALLLANNSITMTDFESGIQAAKAAMELVEYRADFFKPALLCEKLKEIDGCGFDAIAVIRGGGVGIEHLDDIDLLETVTNLRTPIISAVGHPEERLYFKEIADKEVSTPTGLGQYFNEIVEHVAEMKVKSKAVLVEQVRKQYEEQIVTLQKQLETQAKSQSEERASFQKQLDSQAKARVEERVAFQKQIDAQSKSQCEERISFQRQLDAQSKSQREEREALVAASNANLNELGELRQKIKWMGTKMQEQKSKIIKLTVGLLITIGTALAMAFLMNK